MSPERAASIRRVVIAILVVGSIRACSRLTEDSGSPPGTTPAVALVEVPRTVALAPEDDRGSTSVTCDFSHRNDDDPIVHPGEPGASHSHDYFGAGSVDAWTKWTDLASLGTTCDNPADWSSYWVPTLSSPDGPIDPVDMAVYLRTPPLAFDALVAPPNGLELVSVRAGWDCSRTGAPMPHPVDCPANATSRFILEFPDCWDGEHLRRTAGREHLVASVNGECPRSHPVHIPLIVTEVRYELRGRTTADLRLSSGDHHSAHGDVLFAWDRDVLEAEMNGCLARRVVCDLTWSSFVGA